MKGYFRIRHGIAAYCREALVNLGASHCIQGLDDVTKDVRASISARPDGALSGRTLDWGSGRNTRLGSTDPVDGTMGPRIDTAK